MIRNYYSNGKLLLSGEYLVLYGAGSLVVPLKVGQQMKVIATGLEANPVIRWEAYVLNVPWFHAEISIKGLKILTTNEEHVAIQLLKLLEETRKLNPILFEKGFGYEIITHTGFDHNWGFGSSSALVANMAQWALIDPFELHFRTSGGSGADVAGAVSPGPVVYRLANNVPQYYRVDFKPSFIDHILLVYTGKKQITSVSVDFFKNNPGVSDKVIEEIDELTLAMTQTESITDFMEIMAEHEKILSGILSMDPVKTHFPDFPGEIKSLGAWGGDFIMAVSESAPEEIIDYFDGKNMHTVFSLKQLLM